jgi:hypothetical protein
MEGGSMDVRLDGEIRVSLSERNLRDLLAQAESRGAKNPSLTVGDSLIGQLVRTCEQPDGNYVQLRVVVEADDIHYGGWEPGFGTIGYEGGSK